MVRCCSRLAAACVCVSVCRYRCRYLCEQGKGLKKVTAADREREAAAKREAAAPEKNTMGASFLLLGALPSRGSHLCCCDF